MTLRIAPQVLWGLLFLVVSWGGSAGIAFAVTEWRGGGEASRYVECIDVALAKDLDTYEQLLATRPVPPESPGANASAAAFDAYQQQYKNFENEAREWDRKNVENQRNYIVATRACSNIVD